MIKNAYLFLKISKKKSHNIDVQETNRIRELETMIKISEAFAKMRMVNNVDLSDALEAIRITQKFKI
jgi:DNA replicative helicase MCM subunit Mcm2 (Cdc46/Mcm family)